MTDTATLGKTIRTSVELAGSFLLEAMLPSNDDHKISSVIVDAADIGSLIEAVRPKVVYLLEKTFDIESELHAAQEALTELGMETLPAELKACRRRLDARKGQVCIIAVSIMVDGILHEAVSSDSWYDELNETIDSAISQAQEDADAGRVKKKLAATAEVKKKASELAAHPSFNFGRVSFEKRLLLATELYDECDQSRLSEITRLAEALFWLDQSGFERKS